MSQANCGVNSNEGDHSDQDPPGLFQNPPLVAGRASTSLRFPKAAFPRRARQFFIQVLRRSWNDFLRRNRERIAMLGASEPSALDSL